MTETVFWKILFEVFDFFSLDHDTLANIEGTKFNNCTAAMVAGCSTVNHIVLALLLGNCHVVYLYRQCMGVME